MARGQLDLALVVGGEALATRRHLPDPAWSYPPEQPQPYPITIDRLERKNGIFQAYLTFALLDTARRGHLGQSVEDRRQELGRLMAPMSEVAAAQPEHAWFPVARAPEEISTATPDNRMVATPYTKLMTAIMDVDMAAAVLMATEERADALGVPAEPAGLPPRERAGRGALHHGGPARAVAVAGHGRGHAVRPRGRRRSTRWPTSTSTPASPARCRSPAMRSGSPTGREPDRHRRAPLPRGTGQQLRHPRPGRHGRGCCGEDPGSYGLVSGIGMHMTSHSASLWSTRPGAFVPTPPAGPAPHRAGDRPRPTAPAGWSPSPPSTPARDPEWTALICDLPDGSRSYARLEEPIPADDDLVGADGHPDAPGDNRGATTAQPLTRTNRLRRSRDRPELRDPAHDHPLRARRRPHRPDHHRPARGPQLAGHGPLRPAADGLGAVR